MNESAFDPETFLTTDVVGEMATSFTPIPDGDYAATIDGIGEPRFINGSPVVDVIYAIHDVELAETMGLEKLTVRQSLFLDVGSQGEIALGPNKNVRLGRLRVAVNQHDSSAPWNFNMLIGELLTITVGHRVDKNDSSVMYNDVTRTSPSQ